MVIIHEQTETLNIKIYDQMNQRQILFRGMTASNEWVEGYLVKQGVSCSIEKPIEWRDNERYFVDPESVGQFTGLHDKNGKKIFEGDVILCWVSRYPDTKHKGIVVYNESCAAFQYKYKGLLGGNPTDFLHTKHHFEIIGNIHDNQNLLQP